MIKFKYLDFDQDLAEIVSRENAEANCLFICPNHSSLRGLQTVYQKYTSFRKVLFLTMDQFTSRLLQSDIPLLKEEKRMLAFYAALGKKQKDFFHIDNYFQSLSLAQKFFTFFEELADELVTFDEVKKKLAEPGYTLDWQGKTFEELQAIRESYREYIQKRGFADSIFRNIEHQDFMWLNQFERIVVVNQFYFTNLEKHLLPKDKTIIYVQLPQEIYNEQDMCCREVFGAEHLQNKLTRKMTNLIFCDEFSLKYFLFSNPQETVIDLKLLQDHLQAYGVAARVRSFSESSVYKYYQGLYFLLSEMIEEKGFYLVPLNSLITVYCEGKINEAVLNFLYKLVENHYKYLDLNMELVNYKMENSVKDDLRKLFNLLLCFKGLNDFIDFKIVIEEINRGLPKIMSEEEFRYSDTAEVFYRLQEDFWILAEIKVIDDWQSILGNQGKRDFALGSNLLRLFLDYAKAKTCRYNLLNEHDLTRNITALNNTRNLTYKKITIVDTIEGTLPPTRKTPFLLTENQRRNLGLKTYSDIVLREKYYFFRLVAQSREVIFLSRQREEDATEISSFVEELLLAFPELFTLGAPPTVYSLKGHCANWLKPEKKIIKPEISDAFFTLPFDSDTDLRDKKMIISPSSIITALEQPFLYYINNMLRLKKREVSIKMDYEPLQMGQLIHGAFANIWERILQKVPENRVNWKFDWNQDNYADRALASYLARNKEIILQQPHNHSDLYFDKIIKDFITDSLKIFLKICDNSFTNKNIKLFPERDDKNRNEKQNNNAEKFLFTLDDITVLLEGRADLRIEVEGTNEMNIYDYKTSKKPASSNKQYDAQLNMYHHLYYNQGTLVRKWIYFVPDMEAEEYGKDDGYSELENKLEDTLKRIFAEGFYLGLKAGAYEDEELTRRLLYNQRRAK